MDKQDDLSKALRIYGRLPAELQAEVRGYSAGVHIGAPTILPPLMASIGLSQIRCTAACASPSGKLIALATTTNTSRGCSRSVQKVIYIRELDTGRERHILLVDSCRAEAIAEFSSVAFASESVVLATTKTKLYAWDLRGPAAAIDLLARTAQTQHLQRWDGPHELHGIYIPAQPSASGAPITVALCTAINWTVIRFSGTRMVSEFAIPLTERLQHEEIEHMAIDPTGNYLAVSCASGLLMEINLSNGAISTRIDPHSRYARFNNRVIRALCYGYAPGDLFAGTEGTWAWERNAQIEMWNRAGQKKIIDLSQKSLVDIACLSSGKALIALCSPRQLCILNGNSTRRIASRSWWQSPFEGVFFCRSPYGGGNTEAQLVARDAAGGIVRISLSDPLGDDNITGQGSC
ncbi:MAG: hypothetical protein AAF355_14685 [Myxococcota bacterium]